MAPVPAPTCKIPQSSEYPSWVCAAFEIHVVPLEGHDLGERKPEQGIFGGCFSLDPAGFRYFERVFELSYIHGKPGEG